MLATGGWEQAWDQGFPAAIEELPGHADGGLVSLPAIVDKQLGRVLLSWLVLGCGCGFAQSAGARQQRELFERGAASCQAGSFDAALNSLQAAHELDPNHVETRHFLAAAHAGLGRSAYRAGDLDRAARHYATADRFWPSQLAVLQGLARIRYDQHLDADAEKLLEKVLLAAPTDVEAMCMLGAIAERGDRRATARDWFLRATELAPDRADLKSHAEKLVRVSAAEDGFTTLEVGAFRIQYDQRSTGIREALGFVQTTLRTAHGELERDLGGAPVAAIAVQLYDPEQYAKVRENPLAAAFFDGKLRIPVANWPAGKTELAANLRHELTHAFLFALFPRLPRWLHEGQAQVGEKKSSDGARSRLRTAVMWLDAEHFEDSFTTSTDAELMRRGYDQALLVATALRKDKRRYLELLAAFAAQSGDTERAIARVHGCSFAELLARIRRGM